MRREFDAAFGSPPAPEPPPRERLLRVAAGGRGWFVRTRELAAVLACGEVVAVPGAGRGLLGLASVRGQVLPLFALTSLIDPAAPAERARLILVAAGGPGIGIGVSSVDGLAELPEEAVRAGAGGRPMPDGGQARVLLDFAALVRGVREGSRGTEPGR
jgi:hypothetical protein